MAGKGEALKRWRESPDFDPVKHAASIKAGLKNSPRTILTQHLISELNAIDPLLHVTKARLLVMRLVELATCEKPELLAIKEVYDRVEGKARQQVDVTHDGESTIRSTAVSVLDDLIREVRESAERGTGAKPLPN